MNEPKDKSKDDLKEEPKDIIEETKNVVNE
jgi:hypothetical protein